MRTKRVHFTDKIITVTADKANAPDSDPENQNHNPEGDFFSGRILLVEDLKVNRDLVAAILKNKGHAVVTASNGAEALELVQAEKFDLVLLDIQMPVLNGIQVAKAIRQDFCVSHTVLPLLAFTARSVTSEIKEFYEAGMDDYIIKPAHPDMLCQIVHSWLIGTEMTTVYAPLNRGHLPLIDFEVLKAAHAHLGEEALNSFYAEMRDAFSATFQDFLNGLTGAEQMRAETHNLASTSGSLGFLRLSAKCRELLELCLEGHLEDESQACRELSALFQETLEAYERFRQSGS